MVRSAAKNFQDVLVVVDPADYAARARRARAAGRPLAGVPFRAGAESVRAYRGVRHRDRGTLAEFTAPGRTALHARGEPAVTPPRLSLNLRKIKELRYGENPHQPAAWYALDSGFGLGAAQVLQGKELSFTNLLDLDSAARIALEFTEPAAAVIKHTNPCGAAIGQTIEEAYVARARRRQPRGVRRHHRAQPADRCGDGAGARVDIHRGRDRARRGGGRAADSGGQTEHACGGRGSDSRRGRASRREVRSILGAMLVQQRDEVVEARSPWSAQDAAAAGLKVATKRAPTDAEWGALRFAWRICAHVKSNAVIFTDASRTLAIGAGQMSRVDAVQVAVMKALNADGKNPLAGSVAASDAFFPFRDGLDAVAKAGATAVVQPGGSLRDSEVIAAADEHGIAMVFTGKRHFDIDLDSVRSVRDELLSRTRTRCSGDIDRCRLSGAMMISSCARKVSL